MIDDPTYHFNHSSHEHCKLLLNVTFTYPLFWSRNSLSFTDDRGALDVIFHIIQLIIGIFGLTLNFFFMITIIKTDSLYTHNMAPLHISMALSGCLTCGGILVFDSLIYAYVYNKTTLVVTPTPFGCRVWAAYTTLASCSSSLNIPAIAFDKMIAVSKPLHYDWIMTPGKLKLLVGCVWTVSGLLMFLLLAFSKSAAPWECVHLGEQGHLTHPFGFCQLTVLPSIELFICVIGIFIPSLLLVVFIYQIYKVTKEAKKSMYCQFILGKLIEVSSTNLKRPEDIPHTSQCQMASSSEHQTTFDPDELSEDDKEIKIREEGSSVDPTTDVVYPKRKSILVGPNPDGVYPLRQSMYAERRSVFVIDNNIINEVSSLSDATDSELSSLSKSVEGSDSLVGEAPPNSPFSFAINSDSSQNDIPPISEAQESAEQETTRENVTAERKTKLSIFESFQIWKRKSIASVNEKRRRGSTVDKTFQDGTDKSPEPSNRQPASISMPIRKSIFQSGLKRGLMASGLGAMGRLVPENSTGTSEANPGQDKAFYVLSIMVGTYLACWLPLGVLIVWGISTPQDGLYFELHHQELGDVALWSTYITSCINPIIYSLYNKPLLKAMKKSIFGREEYRHRPSFVISKKLSRTSSKSMLKSRTTIMRSHSYTLKNSPSEVA